MNKLICKNCNGDNLIMQDNLFVCQDCGRKYSIEEAKKIMNQETLSNTNELLYERELMYIKDADLKSANKIWSMTRNKIQSVTKFSFYEKHIESNVSEIQISPCTKDNSFSAKYDDIRYAVTETSYALIYKLLYLTICINQTSYSIVSCYTNISILDQMVTSFSNDTFSSKRDIEIMIDILEKNGAKRIKLCN